MVAVAVGRRCSRSRGGDCTARSVRSSAGSGTRRFAAAPRKLGCRSRLAGREPVDRGIALLLGFSPCEDQKSVSAGQLLACVTSRRALGNPAPSEQRSASGGERKPRGARGAHAFEAELEGLPGSHAMCEERSAGSGVA